MGFLKRMMGGGGALDGPKLAASPNLADYGQIHLLAAFATPRPLHAPGVRQRWNRVLPQPYDETIQRLVKVGWLQVQGDNYATTRPRSLRWMSIARVLLPKRRPFCPRVRKALAARDASEALDLRRQYEARFPLGEAEWTGPEPQMSHSSLTRRILFMQHWLLDGLSPDTVDWLKHYAAEQHLWGTHWQLAADEVPTGVQDELATPAMDGVEAAYWKSRQLGLYVDNNETWLRCKGGDHVRRLKIAGPDDEFTCATCKALLGKEFLVARAPELPLRDCTCPAAASAAMSRCWKQLRSRRIRGLPRGCAAPRNRTEIVAGGFQPPDANCGELA